MYRPSRHTSIHTHLIVITYFLSSCIRLCLLLPLSYFRFRSIPSLYDSMFILNPVQRLACRHALTINCTTNDHIVHSFPNMATFHRRGYASMYL